MPTSIAGEPTAGEGHKEGLLDEHPRNHGHNLSGEPEGPHKLPAEENPTEAMSLIPGVAREPTPNTVPCQPKRTQRGHATGMPSPSDAGLPKRTLTKGQDKKPTRHSRGRNRDRTPGRKRPEAPHPHTTRRRRGSTMEANLRPRSPGAANPAREPRTALKMRGAPH